MNLGAFIRDVDDAGFLLRRCVHSPGGIAGCPGQQNYCPVPNPKKQTQSKKIWKIWAFWSRCAGFPSTDGRRSRRTGKLWDSCTLASCRPRISLSRFGAASAQGHHHMRYVGTPTQIHRLGRAEPRKALANPMCLACFSLRGNASTVQTS